MKNKMILILSLFIFLAVYGSGMIMAGETTISKIPVFNTTNSMEDISKIFGKPAKTLKPEPGTMICAYKENEPYPQYGLQCTFRNLTGNASSPEYSFWSITMKSSNKTDEKLPDDALFYRIGDVLDESLLALKPEVVGYDAPVSKLKFSKLPLMIVREEEGNYLQVEMVVLIPNKAPFITREERLFNPSTGLFMTKRPEIDFKYLTKNWKELYIYAYKQFGSVKREYYDEYSHGMPLWKSINR